MNWSVPQTSMPIKSPAITPGIEPLPEASFYIPATEPTTRLQRTMKRDDCFLVFDSHGDIGASPGGPDGLFNCDTLPLAFRVADQRTPAPPPGVEPLRRQLRTQCGPHKSGHLLRQAYPAAE